MGMEDGVPVVETLTATTIIVRATVIAGRVRQTKRNAWTVETPDGAPRYETSAARVAGWNDPGNTTGWAGVPEWVNRSRLRER